MQGHSWALFKPQKVFSAEALACASVGNVFYHRYLVFIYIKRNSDNKLEW